MKFTAFLLSVFAALGVSASAQGVAIGPGSVKLGRLSIGAPNTPEYQVTGGQNKRYEIKKWLEFELNYDTLVDIDELTFKFTAMIEGKLLDGDVTYVNITKGKDKWAVVYISPKSIDKLTGGKALTPAAIGNVWVEVTRQGVVLGKESKEKGAQPNIERKTGMILNKDQTPFAPLFYDRYEEIKPTR